MPFQLIYTSAPHLLESAGSGYGIVARSADMPAALYKQLPVLSAPGDTACRVQFFYRTTTTGAEHWHILTCIQHAGADYSGRACHTAHHLAFSQQEVSRLLNLPQRLTPAGISLALFRAGFWVSKWEAEPQLLTAEPRFPSELLPDASLQPTWKQYTGHKANARAFYTPPYDKECFVIVPDSMKQEEILALLHESDWLSHTHGWGATYTTAADERSRFAETKRIITRPKSALGPRLPLTGQPVLRINATLELPVVPPPSAALAPDPDQPKESLLQPIHQKSAGYHYTEEPDWTLFDIPIPGSPYKKAMLAGGACVLCSMSLVFWYANSSTTTPQTDSSLFIPEEILLEQSPYSRFSDLIKSPYNHDSTNQLMQELSLLPGKTIEETTLAECAILIRNSASTNADHAAALKRICECARILGIEETSLSTLYLHEATHAITADEWQNSIDAAQVAEWEELVQEEPAVAEVLEMPEWIDFAPRCKPDDEEEPPMLATASEETASESEKDAPPTRVSMVPEPVSSGGKLPELLVQALAQPLTLTSGNYVVSILKQGASLQPPRKLELSAEGFRLHISPSENDGEYRLTPSHTQGKPTDMPEVIISVHNGKLRTVRSQNNFAAVSFPVPNQGEYLTNIILAPEFGIPLPASNEITLPEAKELRLQITAADIECAYAKGTPVLRLSRKIKNSGFPWEQDKNRIEKLNFSINLPVLNIHNKVTVTQGTNSSYTCQKTSVIHQSEEQTAILCKIEHKPELPQSLANAFERITNAPCCGDSAAARTSPSLAVFYHIISALGNQRLKISQRKKLHHAYFKTLADTRFNAIIHEILPGHHDYLVSAKDATASGLRNRRMRQNISDQLDRTAIQSSILNSICKYISAQLAAEYERGKQQFENETAKRPMLILKTLKAGEPGELLWHFHLKNNTKSTK